MSKLLSDDRQEQFNIAVAGIAAQGWEQSTKPSGACVYRADMTAECKIRCALGHLIRDEDYELQFDNGYGTSALLKDLGVDPDDTDTYSFLTQLQQAHDARGDFDIYEDTADMALMKNRLRKFAAMYNLTIPEILAAD